LPTTCAIGGDDRENHSARSSVHRGDDEWAWPGIAATRSVRARSRSKNLSSTFFRYSSRRPDPFVSYGKLGSQLRRLPRALVKSRLGLDRVVLKRAQCASMFERTMKFMKAMKAPTLVAAELARLVTRAVRPRRRAARSKP
jgi:hypothetical protein